MGRPTVDVLLDPTSTDLVIAAQMHFCLAGSELNQVVAELLRAFGGGRPGGDDDVLGCGDLLYPLVVRVAVEQEIELLLKPPAKSLGFRGIEPVLGVMPRS